MYIYIYTHMYFHNTSIHSPLVMCANIPQLFRTLTAADHAGLSPVMTELKTKAEQPGGPVSWEVVHDFPPFLAGKSMGKLGKF